MKKEQCEQIIDLNYYNHEQSNRVYGENGLSPTIRTGHDDAKGIKVAVMKNDVKLVGGFGNRCNNDTQWHEQNRVYSSDHCATSIPTGFHPYYTERSERERERVR